MSHDNETLWAVLRHVPRQEPRIYLFRTRAAARAYANARKAKRNNASTYTVKRATWGPEQ